MFCATCLKWINEHTNDVIQVALTVNDRYCPQNMSSRELMLNLRSQQSVWGIIDYQEHDRINWHQLKADVMINGTTYCLEHAGL